MATHRATLPLALIVILTSACKKDKTESQTDTAETKDSVSNEPMPISAPLVTHIFTADPSAHVFEGKVYIYPSHDIESNGAQDDEGGHFDMKDYHVLSMDSIGGEVKDHGVALDLSLIHI